MSSKHGSIAVKLALAKLRMRLGADLRVVMVSHDEIQMEAPPEHAQDYDKLAVECISEAGAELAIARPLDGEAKYGAHWLATH